MKCYEYLIKNNATRLLDFDTVIIMIMKHYECVKKPKMEIYFLKYFEGYHATAPREPSRVIVAGYKNCYIISKYAWKISISVNILFLWQFRENLVNNSLLKIRIQKSFSTYRTRVIMIICSNTCRFCIINDQMNLFPFPFFTVKSPNFTQMLVSRESFFF